MDKYEQAVNSLEEGIKTYVDTTAKNLPYDKTFSALILAVNTDNIAGNTYDIKLNGIVYKKIKTCGGTCTVNEIVKVKIPQNNPNNLYIEKFSGSDITGVVTSVNGKTGDVTISASDVGSLPTSTPYVSYSAQTLSTTQQDQVRTNIGSINDKNFVYTQSTEAATWTINHNLNKYPCVKIVDSNNNTIMADVNYIDLNNISITFSPSLSGKAFLN